MIGTDLPALSIADLQSLLRRREVSPREVIDVLQGRIEAVDGDLGAYLSLDVEAALKEAEHANVDLPLGALGPDTGGSIRQPAALCGVVGLKPTYGRVSRFGLVAFASSLDQIGPVTKTVRDAALIMNVIAGHDPQDSTSLNEPVPDYTASLGKDLRGIRLGLQKEYMIEGIDPQV